MSSAVVSTSAVQGRPFVFDFEESVAEAGPQPSGTELFAQSRPPQRVAPTIGSGAFSADSRLAGITPASRLRARPTPEMVSSGIAAMDELTGGLPRGCLTEICGPASSGRTTLLLAALAAATRRGEFCVVVDASDALDPQSVAAARVEWERLLWVRCGEDSCPAEHRLEQVLRASDLLLESGGFGLIALDLGDLPEPAARRIPLTTWFRFRRAVEHTPTVLLAVERQPIAGSCSSLLIRLGSTTMGAAGNPAAEPSIDSPFLTPSHAQLLTELKITAEMVRSRLDRKPVRSAEIRFAGKTVWAG
jgi:recA bacterial DNA recombination protein